LSLDTFLMQFENFCNEHLSTKNTSKFDISLLRNLCNVIENSYEQKHNVDKKLDKRNVVINEYIR